MPKRIFQRKIYQKNKKARALFFILKFLVFCVLLGFIGAGFLFLYYAKDLPRPEKFTERSFIESTKIYDRTGKILLYEMYKEERREIVPLDQISDYLKQAAISAEDANFYSHSGLDFTGIFRAVRLNLQLKKPLYGGSTISQQLVRSTFFSTEKTIERKIKEIILTLELERRYSKEQILDWYLNQIPFGPNIYGAEAASKAYFEKSSKDLTPAEAAALASMIQAPSYLSPYGKHIDELFIRKDYILDRMAQEGYLTKEQAEEAKKEELKFAEFSYSIKAPHFVLYVQDELLETYGRDFLEKGGLKVYTSLDWELQKKAEQAVKNGVENNKWYNAHNGALVSISPESGEILAMVGSKDWFADPYPENCLSGKNCQFDPKLNAATYRIGRQPGSSFKPFVYATAFSKGHTDTETVIDEETNFGLWGDKEYIPRNYDGIFRGKVTLRQALAQSLNVPSVKVLLDLAGLTESIETAKKMGVKTLNRPLSAYGPSIVLGGGEVRLIDMVSSYSVFANEGLKMPALSILRIENSNGEIIEENKKTPRRVLKKETAILINDILSDNKARAPMFGPYSLMYFSNYDVAAKTGTTNDYRDAWIIGYSPTITAGVWIGNNDNTAMKKQPGIVLAGPIWRQFMNYALEKMPKKEFSPYIPPLPELPKELLEKTEENLAE